MKVSLIIITLLLVTGCAQNTTSTKENSYSAETEKSFEDIEKEKAIELYKKLRWENWQKIQKQHKALRPRSTRSKVARKKTYYIPKKTKKRRPLIPPLSEEKMKEVKIEISQNMSMYCMAKRKDSRFKDENECHAFTQNVLDDCQDKVQQPWVDKSIVRCIKRKLRY